jgi:hypothetical protein
MADREPIVEPDFLGLSAEAATVKAEHAGWSARAYTKDSVLTADRRTDRVNFELDDRGVVVSARVF